MEKVYNKLVRDKIPEIIVGNGGEPFTRILDEDEYKVALETKLMEEYNEVLLATGEERVEELADMLEVISSLAKLEGKSLEEVLEVKNKKCDKRGGFEKRIFLEKVEE